MQLGEERQVGNRTVRTVTFEWSTEHGECYDCGAPAAYRLQDCEGEEGNRCSVCAALSAIEDGEEFVYLFSENPVAGVMD